jgi:hypothetical protein
VQDTSKVLSIAATGFGLVFNYCCQWQLLHPTRKYNQNMVWEYSYRSRRQQAVAAAVAHFQPAVRQRTRYQPGEAVVCSVSLGERGDWLSTELVSLMLSLSKLQSDLPSSAAVTSAPGSATCGCSAGVGVLGASWPWVVDEPSQSAASLSCKALTGPCSASTSPARHRTGASSGRALD